VANGVVEAYKTIGTIRVPIIVRLQGTNAEEAKKIIDNSGLEVFSAISFREAAELVTKILNKSK
jgi:succinyl-CoA synthetase beta subunit